MQNGWTWLTWFYLLVCGWGMGRWPVKSLSTRSYWLLWKWISGWDVEMINIRSQDWWEVILCLIWINLMNLLGTRKNFEDILTESTSDHCRCQAPAYGITVCVLHLLMFAILFYDCPHLAGSCLRVCNINSNLALFFVV